MKKRELEELKKLKNEELLSKIEKLNQEKFTLAAKIRTGEEKNLKAARNVRRDISQIFGIIASKEK